MADNQQSDRFGKDSYSMRRVASAFQRKFGRPPTAYETASLQTSLATAASLKGAPLKWMLRQIDRGSGLSVVQEIERRLERLQQPKLGNPRMALRHGGFSPTAYLVEWNPPGEAFPDAELHVRFVPVIRYGERLLLGSGRYLLPRPDARFVEPDRVPHRPVDLTEAVSVPATAANLPAELLEFGQLVDADTPS